MSQSPNDPAGATYQFQDFAGQQQQEQPAAPGVNKGLILGIVAVVAVVAIIAIALLLM